MVATLIQELWLRAEREGLAQATAAFIELGQPLEEVAWRKTNQLFAEYLEEAL